MSGTAHVQHRNRNSSFRWFHRHRTGSQTTFTETLRHVFIRNRFGFQQLYRCYSRCKYPRCIQLNLRSIDYGRVLVWCTTPYTAVGGSYLYSGVLVIVEHWLERAHDHSFNFKLIVLCCERLPFGLPFLSAVAFAALRSIWVADYN